jgi:hypothetical protein
MPPWGSSPWGDSAWEVGDLATLLQIVDADDSSNVLFDLNDPLGANSATYGGVTTALLSDLDLGVPTLQTSAQQTGTFNRDARAPMKLRLRMTHASSPDNLAIGIGRLAQYLAQGCVMKWITNNGTQVRYIDVDPSETPVLYSGRELGIFEATILIDQPNGVLLQLSRLPYLRGDALTASANKLLNPTLLRDSDANGTPDSWTKISTPTLTIASTTESLHVVAASANLGIQQNTGAASASVGQIWTLSADVKVATGTVLLQMEFLASGGGFVNTANVTQAATGWKRISATGTAGATTDHIAVDIYSSGAAATFDVRNVQLELAPAATSFRVCAQTINVDPVATPFAQYLPVYNPSTAPAPCQIELAFPDASTAGVEVDYAMMSNYGILGRNRLADFLNGPNYAQAESTGNGWTVTLATGTTSTADGNASGGNMARTTHTTDPNTLAKRITWTRSTTLDCLRGRYTVYARVLAAAAKIYDLQLNWSAGTAALLSNDVVQHDTTAAVAFNYVYISLGEIELPEELNITIANLTLELWTGIDSGAAANLDVDHIALVPANDVAFIAASTNATGSVLGKDLGIPKDLGAGDPTWVAGSASGTAMRLDAVNEAAGWGGNTNGAFSGAGHHRVEATFAYSSLFTATWFLQIANLTDNVVTVDATAVPSGAGMHTYVMEFDGVAGKVYQPRVTITAYTMGYITVYGFSHSVTPTVVQNEKVRSDPGSLPTRSDVEKLDSSGNLLIPFSATTVPFWLPPGLSLIYLNEFDVSPAGYLENKSTLTRTMTATATVYPRFYS